MADPSGSNASSSAARAWNSLLYATTGGQAPRLPTLEAPVAQALSQIVASRRATRRSLEHPSPCIMASLRGLELLGQTPCALAGADGSPSASDLMFCS